MKYIAAIVVAVVFSASVSVGLTQSVMQNNQRHEIERVQVSSFNQGFQDGACKGGQDGFGHICK